MTKLEDIFLASKIRQRNFLFFLKSLCVLQMRLNGDVPVKFFTSGPDKLLLLLALSMIASPIDVSMLFLAESLCTLMIMPIGGYSTGPLKISPVSFHLAKAGCIEQRDHSICKTFIRKINQSFSCYT